MSPVWTTTRILLTPEHENLLYDIELALAEATSGLMGLDELHAALRALLDQAHPNIEAQRQPA